MISSPEKDICNTIQYDLKQNNLVSLLLFFDGASYNKSNSDPLHAFFSTICELPPLLRNSTRNIITHSLWTGSTPNFNVFLSHFNKQLDQILTTGVFIDTLDITVRVKCHAFIADAPERALVLNMNKFNGKHGCIMCMQEGENLNKNGRGNNFKYTHKPDDQLIRTQEKYLHQVQESVSQKCIFEGIKGPTYLANWLRLPDATIIDYMHASLLGVTKHLLNIWISNENKKKEFYLGSITHNIDKILLEVKYPIEFPRMQRSISDHLKFFKASEYRSFLFYAGLPILKYFLPDFHFKHFVQYIISMRLLCDKNFQTEDLIQAFKIINQFIQEFEKLYGKNNMTFNLHSHLHLPQQVMR